MPVERCTERERLSKTVAATISEVFRAKVEYESAKNSAADNAVELAIALGKAREAEVKAEHALEEHVKQHGCRA